MVCASDEQSEVIKVSDYEKEILQKVKMALPSMSDFQQGYILGRVDVAAETASKLKGKNSPSER